MRWPWQKERKVESIALKEERAKTQVQRAAMSEAVVNFNRERNALDAMVKRSLELLESKH